MEAEDSHVAMISGQGHLHQTYPPNKMPQYLITLAVTLVVFAGGTVIGWSSPALKALQSEESALKITEEEGSWVGSLLAVGAFVGALPAGACADVIGKKLIIMLTTAPQIVSWMLIYFATSVNTLYIARLLGGIGVGVVCAVVPMYVADIAEDSVRGTLGSAFSLMMVLGVLYTYILGAFVHYTLLPLLCGIVNIIFLLAFFRAPESPAFLLKGGRRQQAEAALKDVRGPKYDIYRELDVMEKSLNEQTTEKMSFVGALRKRECLYGFIICIGAMVFQQLSGINIVIFYSASIFKDAGSTLDPAIATIFVGLAQVVSALVSMVLIDRAGRKILLQFSAVAMAICHGLLGYYFKLKISGEDVSSLGLLPLVSVVIYILVFAVGFGPIPWMISGEVMGPEIKATGSSIAVAVNWSFAFFVTKVFQPLNAAVGPAATYWILAGICILAFIFSTFVVIETKGKTLAEVQEELSGKKKKRTNSVL